MFFILHLYNDECLKKLDELIEEGVRVDMILTDPPYGFLNGWESRKGEEIKWDTAIPPKEIYDRANRILRENGMMVLFSYGNYTTQLRAEANTQVPFCYSMIWEKDHFAFALGCKKTPVSYYEDINVFMKRFDTDQLNPLRNYSRRLLSFINLSKKEIFERTGNRKWEAFLQPQNPRLTLVTEETYNQFIELFHIDKMDGFIEYEELKRISEEFKAKNKRIFNLNGKSIKSNILKYPKDKTQYHPTQKPVKLLEDLIETYTNEGDVVLDFTMGSGSTGVACLNTNREFIGIEMDKNYFDIAKNRLACSN